MFVFWYVVVRVNCSNEKEIVVIVDVGIVCPTWVRVSFAAVPKRDTSPSDKSGARGI